MKKLLYRNKGDSIGGLPAVSVWKGKDFMLSGKYGWIFPAGKGGRLGVALVHKGGCEHFLYFDIKDLERWTFVIGYSSGTRSQLQYAYDPNSREYYPKFKSMAKEFGNPTCCKSK